jgi:EmrB/QacA subfamily drug resistance transporter
MRSTTHAGAETATSPRWALASLSLVMLLASLGTSIANVGLPELAQAFDASFQDVQWVVLAYLLAITTLIVSAGRLGDIIGRRRLLLTGIILFTAASILCGLAPTLWLLIAARAVQGLGAAIMMALGMALVGASVSRERTGSAMGLLGTMSAIGTALGPSAGGILISGLGWRAIFLVMAPLGLFALLLAGRFLPGDRQSPEPVTARFDIVGTVLLALALTAYALAMTLGRGDFGIVNLSLLIAAVLCGGLFAVAQMKVTSPLIRLATFRDRTLSASLIMNLLVATVMMATLVVGPFYLAHGLNLDNAAIGLVMSVGPVISALSGVPAGRIVDRLGTTAVGLIGLVDMAIGCVALSLLPAMYGVIGYVAALVVLTPGYQLFQAANNTAVMKDVPADRRGVISGLLNLSRNLGLITGAAAMGAVFAFASAATDMTTAGAEQVTLGLRTTFILAAALIACAIVMAALASRSSKSVA